MKIRMVEKKDFKDWLKLRKSLWPEYSLDDLETEMHQYYNQIEKNPTFIAEDPELDICGFIEVSIRNSAPGCRTKNVGYIEGWYVKPECRQMGIGKKLVSTAEKWAMSRGCKEMASNAEEYPVSTVAHKSLGYERVTNDIRFRKTILKF